MPALVFAVASDEARSKAYSSQRLLNLYPEASQIEGKSKIVLLGTAGCKPWGSAGSGPIRGCHEMADILYVVSLNTLYSVNSGGVATSIGTVAGTGHVVMDDSGTQLAIATSGGVGYIYTTTTATFGQITDVDFRGGSSVAYLDGYFLWGNIDGSFQISGLLNGTAFDALDFATAESSPDGLKAVKVLGREVWLMGDHTIEPWINTGNADFPFESLNDTIITKGLLAPYSPAILDNTIFWIGTDQEAGGGPVVYRAEGYTPRVISTPACELALDAETDLDGVRGFGYVQGGHAFYVIVLPSGPAWVYDVGHSMWHERETYGLDRWIGNCHCYSYGKHIVGSYRDGDLYELDLNYFWDDTDIPLIAEGISIPLGDDTAWRTLDSIQFDMETGVGLTTGQGSDPQIMLQISKDRGQTYGNERWKTMGAVGRYGIRVMWWAMGRFRSVVVKFRISDPVKRSIVQTFAEVS